MTKKVIELSCIVDKVMALTNDEYTMVRDILRGQWIANDWKGEIDMLRIIDVNTGENFDLGEDENV